MRNWRFKTHTKLLYTLILVGIGSSCSIKTDLTRNNDCSAEAQKDFNYEIKLHYSQQLIINNKDKYKDVIVLNPLSTDTLAHYIVALHDTQLPDSILTNQQVIRVPIQSIVCMSASHVGALEVLGLQKHLIGATFINGLWDTHINDRIAKGFIKEVGRGMGNSEEQIITLQPDLVTKNDHSKDVNEEELYKIGINTLFYNDWREVDLLGRAEWMKLVGLLFCKSQLADSIFTSTEHRYNAIKALAATAPSKPTVFVARDYRGVWFLPGNGSYIPSMIKDAHAHIKTLDGKSTSLPCSFEKAFQDHYQDDIWLSLKGGTTQTLEEFANESDHYAKFKAFQNGQVYFNNNRVKPNGGNDFWESGSYYPDIILQDLVKIIHPELLPNYQTYYWRQLN